MQDVDPKQRGGPICVCAVPAPMPAADGCGEGGAKLALEPPSEPAWTLASLNSCCTLSKLGRLPLRALMGKQQG